MIKFCCYLPLYNFVFMKIEQYISQLLYRYQCVTVPGFGAFLTEIQPAQLNESSNAFYPPKKIVSFNSQVRNNDGLLANHIAQCEKTSYDEAVNAISSEVGIWNNILELNDKFSLKHIGELSVNAERSLIFSPYDQSNYLREAFGLSSFVSPGIKREVYKQEAESFEEKSAVLFTPEKRKPTSYLRYTAIIILALTAAGSLGYKVYEKYAAEQTLTTEKEIQQEVQNKIQEATFFIESPIPAVTLSVRNQKMPYHIVAGAFRQQDNANKILQKLNAGGFKALVLPKNRHGLFPVVYGSYASYRQAAGEMSKIKREQNPDAWLLVKEF